MRSSAFPLPCARYATLFLPLLLAVSCAPSMETRQLDALRALAPEAGDFRESLASEYLAYAEAEKESGEVRDAEYFALKGLTSAQGRDVFPDAPQDRKLAPGDQPTLNAAHDWLLSSLQPVREQAIPELLARAQLMFDCWLDNAEEEARTAAGKQHEHPFVYFCESAYARNKGLLRAIYIRLFQTYGYQTFSYGTQRPPLLSDYR